MCIKHLKLEFFVVNKIVKEEFNKKSSPNYIFWKIGEKTEEKCPKIIDIVFVIDPVAVALVLAYNIMVGGRMTLGEELPKKKIG